MTYRFETAGIKYEPFGTREKTQSVIVFPSDNSGCKFIVQNFIACRICKKSALRLIFIVTLRGRGMEKII
jgi:hypothetical protein